ncbi:MAG TPA: heavy-metal-associated domain-containing protein [Armatimonadota bacterium]
MATVRYKAPEISCEGCANAIKRALGSSAGIRSVEVVVETKMVTVDYDESKIKPEHIRNLLADAGYEVAETWL